MKLERSEGEKSTGQRDQIHVDKRIKETWKARGQSQVSQEVKVK
jgi:hypothetical protein